MTTKPQVLSRLLKGAEPETTSAAFTFWEFGNLAWSSWYEWGNERESVCSCIHSNHETANNGFNQ